LSRLSWTPTNAAMAKNGPRLASAHGMRGRRRESVAAECSTNCQVGFRKRPVDALGNERRRRARDALAHSEKAAGRVAQDYMTIRFGLPPRGHDRLLGDLGAWLERAEFDIVTTEAASVWGIRWSEPVMVRRAELQRSHSIDRRRQEAAMPDPRTLASLQVASGSHVFTSLFSDKVGVGGGHEVNVVLG
jgi:hypothetical protein